MGVVTDPPAEGDTQRRCWTITTADGDYAQCWLFNGHPGDHQWGPNPEGNEEVFDAWQPVGSEPCG